MAYAEYADVILRYPEVADQAQERIEALLEDVAALIDREMRDAGVEVDAEDESQARNLLSVSCSAVARAALPGGGVYGMTSFTQTAGPVQMSTNYSNPTGDLYLNKGERHRLGIADAVGGQVFYGSDILGGE